MKLVTMERVIINPTENEILNKALEVLDDISLMGDNETSEFAVILAERLTMLQNSLLVCEENDNGAFVTFCENEVTEFVKCECDFCESEEK
jgi:hypothetical protein